MAEYNPVAPFIPGMATILAHVVDIRFDRTQRTFSLDENCIGTEIYAAYPQVARSEAIPLVVYHAGPTIQIWAAPHRRESFRILFVDYQQLPRQRQVIGYVTISHVPGLIRVSDYRQSMADGVIPDILRENTVYIIGIRFVNNAIPASITSYDYPDEWDYTEQI